eukprot:CAMPEP_0172500154 /NCGR_PEP_ID=MMETSP1066-20121228/135216_1 /TAXON_ID=671091 /ORGANISM="Coscinodiscus wailesii, Strain CCMP2513" /LENGTH=32 /DNA_ID= /DNA_START= /DNA_END= /DNA_ORIENTATION=
MTSSKSMLEISPAAEPDSDVTPSFGKETLCND